MPLNKYWPHKTLLWKDWKISWSIFVPFFLFVTYATTFSLLFTITDYIASGWPGFIGPWPGFLHFENRLVSEPWVGIPLLLFTIALATVSLGQERDRETLGLLLAMPYSRQDILFSKVVVGLVQILITLAANALLMTLIVWANAGIPFPFGTPDIWGWALRSFLVLTFIFCFTVLIATVSGTAWGSGILAMIFLFFPAGLYLLLETNFNFWISWHYPWFYAHSYWMWRNIFSDIALLATVPAWIMDFSMFGKYNPVYLYGALVVLSAGAYALARFLFTKNPLENNGEVLVFERLEGIFKLGVVVCFALLGGPLLTALAGIHNPGPLVLSLCYLLAGCVTWFLTNHLLKWRRST